MAMFSSPPSPAITFANEMSALESETQDLLNTAEREGLLELPDTENLPPSLGGSSPKPKRTKKAAEKAGFSPEDLPDETLYIFDGTAMLFQAFYSRESSFYHKGEAAAYLNPALARDIVKEIGLDLREYRECLAEMEISADLQRTNYLREKAKSKDGDETEDIGFKLLEQRKKALLDDAAAVDADFDSTPNTNIDEPTDEEIQLYCGALTVMALNFARFVRDHNPRYVAVAFDAGSRTFRNELFDGYKSTRKSAPLPLVPLFRLAPYVMEELGCRCFQKLGYEADDVMASLSRWGRSKSLSVVHVSSDKDMLQLVDTGVHIMRTYPNPKKGLVGTDEVLDKYQLPPTMLTEYQAIIGDSADSIPGVRGIGPKSALALLKHFGGVEEIVARLRIPEEPVDVECRDSLLRAGFVVRTEPEGKKPRKSKRPIVEHAEDVMQEMEACLSDVRATPHGVLACLLGCGAKQMRLYKDLVTLSVDLPIQPMAISRYDSSGGLLVVDQQGQGGSFGAIGSRTDEYRVQDSDGGICSTESGADSDEINEVIIPTDEELSSAHFKFVGERMPGAADSLRNISSSLSQPLRLLRHQYHRMDRFSQ